MRANRIVGVLSAVAAPAIACLGTDSDPDPAAPNADASATPDVASPAVDSGQDCSRQRATVGVLDPATGSFTLQLPTGANRVLRLAAPSSARPVAGRWKGGPDEVGWFDTTSDRFTLIVTGEPPITFPFGTSEELPLAGDWNGDGNGSIGVFLSKGKQFFLTNGSSGTPAAEYQFSFGTQGIDARPVAGDWDGDGKPGLGVFYPSTGRFDLKNALGPGLGDIGIVTTHTGDDVWPIAGDWSGCGRATVGVFDQSERTFYLLEANETGAKETTRPAPNIDGLLPVAGVWSP
jgi:hypothetical protein